MSGAARRNLIFILVGGSGSFRAYTGLPIDSITDKIIDGLWIGVIGAMVIGRIPGDRERTLPSGHHPDTRWVRLEDETGDGLEVRGRPTIGFGASHFTAGDLTAARHTSDLEPRPEVLLSLDHAQRGLGTASCGPDTHERHRLLEPSYAFSYVLRPIASRPEKAGS